MLSQSYCVFRALRIRGAATAGAAGRGCGARILHTSPTAEGKTNRKKIVRVTEKIFQKSKVTVTFYYRTPSTTQTAP